MDHVVAHISSGKRGEGGGIFLLEHVFVHITFFSFELFLLCEYL